MIFQDPIYLWIKADSNKLWRTRRFIAWQRQRLRRQGKKIARNGRPESSIYEEISSGSVEAKTENRDCESSG